MLAGNSTLTQMGFAISFGIAIAAFVMALFFTLALTAVIGHAACLPLRRLGRGNGAADRSLIAICPAGQAMP
jgi:RND superfamily putative drug exporter